MNIAILGWGSLLWDRQEKHQWFYETIGDWQSAGPTLPLEFCRVSTSRARALTLVLQHPPIGSPCVVSFAVSKRTELVDALRDVERREGCEPEDVGLCVAGDLGKGKGQFKDLVAVFRHGWMQRSPKSTP